MVLGDVIGVEPAPIIEFDERETILVMRAQGTVAAVHVIKNAEFHSLTNFQ